MSTNYDYLFSALAFMGNSSSQMSWANNCVEDIKDVPEEIKIEMKRVNEEIHRLQEKLREIRSDMKTVDKVEWLAGSKPRQMGSS